MALGAQLSDALQKLILKQGMFLAAIGSLEPDYSLPSVARA